MGSSAIARWRPISSSCASPEAPPCTVTVAIESSSSGAGSSAENALPATVLAGGFHEPLHAVGVGARRPPAPGREHEARARAGGAGAAAHLGLALRPRPTLGQPRVYDGGGHP